MEKNNPSQYKVIIYIIQYMLLLQCSVLPELWGCTIVYYLCGEKYSLSIQGNIIYPVQTFQYVLLLQCSVLPELWGCTIVYYLCGEKYSLSIQGNIIYPVQTFQYMLLLQCSVLPELWGCTIVYCLCGEKLSRSIQGYIILLMEILYKRKIICLCSFENPMQMLKLLDKKNN